MGGWGIFSPRGWWRRRKLRAAARLAIARLDRRIAAQLDAILQAPRLRQLAGSWIGLERLASLREARIGLRLLSLTRRELADETVLRDRLVATPFSGTLPEPFGALVLDMGWSDAEEDVAILRRLAGYAAAACAPLLSDAAPALLDTRREAMSPEWLALRDAPESQFLFLAGPGAPSFGGYGATGTALLLAELVARAVARDGWGAWFDEPDGRARVEGRARALEIAIEPGGHRKLLDQGLVLLEAGTDHLHVAGARSVRRTPAYQRQEATDNARITGLLPFVLGIGAVMQPLMIQARDLLRRGVPPEELQRRLQGWMDRHHPPAQEKGAVPTHPAFRDGRVELRGGQGGAPVLAVWLSPHMPLHDLTTSVRQIATITALDG